MRVLLIPMFVYLFLFVPTSAVKPDETPKKSECIKDLFNFMKIFNEGLSKEIIDRPYLNKALNDSLPKCLYKVKDVEIALYGKPHRANYDPSGRYYVVVFEETRGIYQINAGFVLELATKKIENPYISIINAL